MGPMVYWLTAWISGLAETGLVMCIVEIVDINPVMPPVVTVSALAGCCSILTAAALADLH